MNSSSEQRRFGVIARVLSFRHAFRGIWIFVRNCHNSWIEIFYSLIVIVLGFCFSISPFEWMALILCICALLAAEAFNTAIEIHMDLTSPGKHSSARDTKDIAAGAVLIMVIATVVISGIIFIPYILKHWAIHL